MEDQNKDLTIAALMESNEMLGELLSRYRRSNMLLRRINSELRRLKNIQVQNDEEFKSMCQGDTITAEEWCSDAPTFAAAYKRVTGKESVDAQGCSGGLPESHC